jgi:prophage regulatory protein
MQSQFVRAATNQQRILRCRQVLARTGLSRSSLYALIGRGEFPSAVRLSQRSVGWLEQDVAQWIEARSRVAPVVARAADTGEQVG